MLDVSPRSVDRADAAGQLPSPVFIGGSKKFLLEGSRGIRAWLLAGCPRREDFEGDTTIQTGGGGCSMSNTLPESLGVQISQPESHHIQFDVDSDPSPAEVRAKSIPAELQELDQWVLWKYEDRGGCKPAKVPYQANNRRASHSDSSTWTSFESAFCAFQQGGFEGIGFVFTASDSFCGVDLDNCRDQKTEEICSWAQAIIDALDSYSEVSPSGNGVKVIVRAKWLQAKGRKRPLHDGAIEVYDQKRYFTITGRHLHGSPGTIESREGPMRDLHARYFEDSHNKNSMKPSPSEIPESLRNTSDERLLEIARKSRNGEKFCALWEGRVCDWAKMTAAGNGDGHIDTSSSGADLALVSMLAFYTHGDFDRIDRLFRKSGLYRDKWDRVDYAQRTIAKAMAGRTDYFGVAQEIDRDERGTIHEEQHSAPGSHSASDSGRPGGGETVGRTEFALTDLGNAERLVARHGSDFRWCESWGYVVYNGARWIVDKFRHIEQFAKQTIRSIEGVIRNTTDMDKRVALKRHANKSEAGPRISAMIKLARSEAGIATSANHFDQNDHLFNVCNGTLNLLTGELQPHRREDYITKVVDVTFDPAATCPLFQKFLNTVMRGDEAMIQFLKVAIGYSLCGDTSERCVFIIHGMGRNGKSVFLAVCRWLLGDYARTIRASTLMATRNERGGGSEATPAIAALAGARFVTASESEEGSRLAEAKLKELAGGTDTISGRFLFKNEFTFKPTFKLWFATNHKPDIRGTDFAVWSRIRLIPFEVVIPETEVDRQLPAKLKTELSGILNWALEGHRFWRDHGMPIPEKVTQATKEYKEECDTVGKFLTECCQTGAEQTTQGGELYEIYRWWAQNNGMMPLSNRRFCPRMKEHSGITHDPTSRYPKYNGVDVKPDVRETYQSRSQRREYGGRGTS